MTLVYGILALSVSIFLLSVMTVVCRNPRTAQWLNNGLSFIALPFVVGLLAMSVALIASFITTFSSASLNLAANSMELGAVAAIILITIVAVKALRIKKRLAGYEQLPAAAQVIELNGAGPTPVTPPHQPRPVNRAA